MRLFTLLAGYAAGLAVAMKYRKDKGTSKLDNTGSKLNSFIDEVVDIHKTAFAEVKWFVRDNFDDVDNFDDLQSKVSGMISEFSGSLETHIENAKKAGITKTDELLKIAQEFYDSHEATLDTAKAKAASFTGISEATIDSWLGGAHKELSALYEKMQSKFADTTTAETPKKTTTRKPASKKAE
jgi:hypothetical protein